MDPVSSNAFDDHDEACYGTKGTLILSGESDPSLFEEGAPAGAAQATGTKARIEIRA